MAIDEKELSTLVDVTRPYVPCMYDYYLGGQYNSAADRAAARKVIEAAPTTPMIARENRRFLRRTVRFLSKQGVRQFLDIGSGLPTVGNTHEIARSVNPDAKVAYIDNEPVVKILGEAILAKEEGTAVVIESAFTPQNILNNRTVKETIDFAQPIGLLMYSVLQFVPDEKLPEIMTTLLDAMPSGSYFVASHSCLTNERLENYDESQAERVKEQYKNAATTVTNRSLKDIEAKVFARDEWTVVEPGVVWIPQWRPDEQDKSEDAVDECYMVGAVSRKA